MFCIAFPLKQLSQHKASFLGITFTDCNIKISTENYAQRFATKDGTYIELTVNLTRSVKQV